MLVACSQYQHDLHLAKARIQAPAPSWEAPGKAQWVLQLWTFGKVAGYRRRVPAGLVDCEQRQWMSPTLTLQLMVTLLLGYSCCRRADHFLEAERLCWCAQAWSYLLSHYPASLKL